MLRIENISKQRMRSTGETVRILQHVDLDVAPAQITAVIGPSGSGKSTLLRLVNRLEDADDGRIELQGADIRSFDPLALRRQVVMVLQMPFVFPGTVLDNLQHPFILQNKKPPYADSSEVQGALQMCGLERGMLATRASSLSVGQQQRVCLARALLLEPKLLLLDEPTSALDRPTGDRLGQTLKRICREHGLTILMVTHDLRLAGRCADVVAYLEKGRMLESGASGALLNNPGTKALQRFLAEPETQEG